MTCEIFICTFRRDFEYLKWCLRSIAKFATGFSGVTIVVPEQDQNAAFELIGVTELFGRRIHLRTGTEWPAQGFLWHMWVIMNAELWMDCNRPAPDYICHLDPDCVFTEPVTPERFFRHGHPIVRSELFTEKIAREPNIRHWYEAVNRCLPFPVLNETMCGHPEIYHIGLYNVARQLIEQKTGRPLAEYMKTCKNSFPQTFAEFPTLGAVALQCFPQFYYHHWQGTGDDNTLNEYPVFQAWSHNPPDVSTHLWWRGKQSMITPVEFYKELGL